MTKKFIRNYAFIDSINLHLGTIKDQGWPLDTRKFMTYLKQKFFVTKAFYFMGYIHTHQHLYTKLQHDGYILIHKPVHYLPGGLIKGNVDTELVLQAMIEFPNYDQAVIVSGDGDFACLATHLSRKHKLKNIIIPNAYKYSPFLSSFAQYHIYLTEQREKLEYKKLKK